MSIDLTKFFVIKPATWIFGALWGNKARKYFELNIAPEITNQVKTLGLISIADTWIKNNLPSWIKDIMDAVKIPASYKSIVENFLITEISALL